jgi:hypothetical protein
MIIKRASWLYTRSNFTTADHEPFKLQATPIFIFHVVALISRQAGVVTLILPANESISYEEATMTTLDSTGLYSFYLE